MGEVYQATDTRLDRSVVIKVLPSETTHDPHARERFEREARALSRLSHPHICGVFDVGHQDPSTGDQWLIFLAVHPEFGRLHADPRFDDLVRRIGIPTR